MTPRSSIDRRDDDVDDRGVDDDQRHPERDGDQPEPAPRSFRDSHKVLLVISSGNDLTIEQLRRVIKSGCVLEEALMDETTTGEEPVPQRDRVNDALRAYGATYAQLAREFAAREGLHSTDATALIEILAAEERERRCRPPGSATASA